MSKNKLDLRATEWREGIVKVAAAMKDTPLTDRALALLISDCTRSVSLTQVLEVLKAIPKLPERYLRSKN